jgi:predicted GNAT family acetyltransferase
MPPRFAPDLRGHDRLACLHVYSSNTTARALYAKLGFRERRQMHIAQLEPV